MSCPEVERVLAIMVPENRATWARIYDLCYRAVCTPSAEASTALEVLIDHMIELGKWSGFRSPERARLVAWTYAARRCGMPVKRIPRTNRRTDSATKVGGGT